MKKDKILVSSLYGITTVGERGQIVIPAEARKELGFKKGEKLIAFSTKRGMLVLANASHLKGTIEKLTELIKPLR